MDAKWGDARLNHPSGLCSSHDLDDLGEASMTQGDASTRWLDATRYAGLEPAQLVFLCLYPPIPIVNVIFASEI